MVKSNSKYMADALPKYKKDKLKQMCGYCNILKRTEKMLTSANNTYSKLLNLLNPKMILSTMMSGELPLN